MAISADPPDVLAGLRRELHLGFDLLSDESEQAATALCRGLAHCLIMVDPAGRIRWARWSESWAEVPEPGTVLQAAYRLSHPL